MSRTSSLSTSTDRILSRIILSASTSKSIRHRYLMRSPCSFLVPSGRSVFLSSPMSPPPPPLATQESVDNLTSLVKSLIEKIDKIIPNSAMVEPTPPHTADSTYASVVRALADSEKIKDKAQRAVLVGSKEKSTP